MNTIDSNASMNNINRHHIIPNIQGKVRMGWVEEWGRELGKITENQTPIVQLVSMLLLTVFTESLRKKNSV